MKIMRKRSDKPRFAGRDEQTNSVNREIAILKKCWHPNVVRLREVIDNPDMKKVYLSTSYVFHAQALARSYVFYSKGPCSRGSPRPLLARLAVAPCSRHPRSAARHANAS